MLLAIQLVLLDVRKEEEMFVCVGRVFDRGKQTSDLEKHIKFVQFRTNSATASLALKRNTLNLGPIKQVNE